jgi:hypothetical protein
VNHSYRQVKNSRHKFRNRSHGIDSGRFNLFASLSGHTASESDALSSADVRKASEAVVDAAIICQQLFGAPEVSWQMRESLVEMISEDPSLTDSLFEKGSALFRLC